MLYQAYQTHSDLMSPFRLMAQSGGTESMLNPSSTPWLQKMAVTEEAIVSMQGVNTCESINAISLIAM